MGEGGGGALALRVLSPVAGGKWRRIYEHPDGSGRLVKVAREDTIARTASAAPLGVRWLHRLYHRRVELSRELSEYRRAERWPTEERRFLQRFFGVAETDLGPGLVVGAIRNPAGELAPNLRHLIEAGADPAEWQTDLDRFLAWFVESDVVVRDFRPQNLVRDRDGHFVLVDGLGDRTVVPFRVWNAGLNRREKARAAESMRQGIARALARRRPAAGG